VIIALLKSEIRFFWRGISSLKEKEFVLSLAEINSVSEEREFFF